MGSCDDSLSHIILYTTYTSLCVRDRGDTFGNLNYVYKYIILYKCRYLREIDEHMICLKVLNII